MAELKCGRAWPIIFLNQTLSGLQCLESISFFNAEPDLGSAPEKMDPDPGPEHFVQELLIFLKNIKKSKSYLDSFRFCYYEVNQSEIWKFILNYYLFTILISVESNIFGYGCYFAPRIRISGFLRVRTPYPVHYQSFQWLSFKSRWYLRLNIYSL